MSTYGRAPRLTGLATRTKRVSAATDSYVDALVSSFAMVFLFALWVGKRVKTDFVLHGALIGVFGALLFTGPWIATTPVLAQPPLYVLAHGLKVLGGICGGGVESRRHRAGPGRLPPD